MKRLLILLLIVTVGFSCIRSNNQNQENTKEEAVIETESKAPFSYLISDGKIGNVSIGDDIQSAILLLEKEFVIKKDSVPACGGCEEYTPVYLVFNTDTTSVLFEIEPGWDENNSDKVFRLRTSSRAFNTDKGLKIGMTVKDLKEKYTLSEIMGGGETGLHIFVEDFEGSFGIEIQNFEDKWWDYTFETIPDDLKINEIIII